MRQLKKNTLFFLFAFRWGLDLMNEVDGKMEKTASSPDCIQFFGGFGLHTLYFHTEIFEIRREM